MATSAGLPCNSVSFTEITNYKGNDGRNRLDVFCAAGDNQVLLRTAWSGRHGACRTSVLSLT